MDHGFRRNDLETSGFREFTSSGGWTRGNVISGGPSSAIGQAPPSNFFNTGFQKSSENTTDWSRNVNVKTYKENVREKPGLDIDLKNRFTALSDT
ncbi:unnamed protein product [Heterobilharzia americana]|nr:unnamed protein product [Heterobilharzia americana]